MKYLRGTSGRARKRAVDNETSVDTPPKKRAIEQHHRPNSPAVPATPEGEDRPSHDRHVKFIKLESKKYSPNQHIIQQLMKRTFTFRHMDILSNSLSLTEALERYPPLRKYDEVANVLTCLML